MIGDMEDRKPMGVPRGTRYKAPSYDPSSGQNWRPGSNFQPHNAVKTIKVCEALDISVAGFLDQVMEYMEIDPETNIPIGWPGSVTWKKGVA